MNYIKKTLTSIVNLPVCNSVSNGSDFGSMLSSCSSFRSMTYCSNNATARGTSSFRANKNFNAVDGDIVFRSIFLFTISINSLTAYQNGENDISSINNQNHFEMTAFIQLQCKNNSTWISAFKCSS